MRPFKTLALQMLMLPGAASLFAPFARGCGVIFMLHRFRAPGFAKEGHNPTGLRRALAHLRRSRYHILSLEQMLRLAARGAVPNRAIAFTIDDGYADHAEVAGPIFAEFDCPVTTFVTTGFLDGRLWFWWDRIEHVFTLTHRRDLRVVLGDQVLAYQWESDAERRGAMADFTARCKDVSNDVKLSGIEQLANAADVVLPATPPACYAPMTWEQLRSCEARGMSFGPHTVTHPVLSRVSDEQSRWELAESWRRLREEARHPTPVFCYPNGQPSDFSEREITTLQQMGFLGAVVGSAGFVSSEAVRREARAPFAVRRLPFPDDDLPRLVQYVGGAERMKTLLRREIA
jgi:peptidoglycan/xylan/chitin deacetylase (PgdA/CDA1 family)